MLITDLKFRNRRNSSEVTVIFDDESILPLDAEMAVRFQLARGMVVSPSLLDDIKDANETLRARKKLISYLAMRKKSTREASTYLKKAGFEKRYIDSAIEAATRLGYLQDTEFAEAFIRTRVKAGKKGRRLITAELLAKGIGHQEAEMLTSQIIEPDTELESARHLAAKKYQTLKDQGDAYKVARLLQQFLMRKGFEPPVCEQVARELVGEATEFE